MRGKALAVGHKVTRRHGGEGTGVCSTEPSLEVEDTQSMASTGQTEVSSRRKALVVGVEVMMRQDGQSTGNE